jgi:hypothetical protein
MGAPRPEDFPVGSVESRAAMRLQLAEARRDGAVHVHFECEDEPCACERCTQVFPKGRNDITVGFLRVGAKPTAETWAAQQEEQRREKSEERRAEPREVACDRAPESISRCRLAQSA